MADRRNTGRYPFVAAVRHEAQTFGVGLWQAANLGLWGMKVVRVSGAGESALAERTAMQVAFELPDGGSLVELLAEVVFDRPRDDRYRVMGLRFSSLPPEVEGRLRAFLLERQPGGR